MAKPFVHESAYVDDGAVVVVENFTGEVWAVPEGRKPAVASRAAARPTRRAKQHGDLSAVSGVIARS